MPWWAIPGGAVLVLFGRRAFWPIFNEVREYVRWRGDRERWRGDRERWRADRDRIEGLEQAARKTSEQRKQYLALIHEIEEREAAMARDLATREAAMSRTAREAEDQYAAAQETVQKINALRMQSSFSSLRGQIVDTSRASGFDVSFELQDADTSTRPRVTPAKAPVAKVPVRALLIPEASIAQTRTEATTAEGATEAIIAESPSPVSEGATEGSTEAAAATMGATEGSTEAAAATMGATKGSTEAAAATMGATEGSTEAAAATMGATKGSTEAAAATMGGAEPAVQYVRSTETGKKHVVLVQRRHGAASKIAIGATGEEACFKYQLGQCDIERCDVKDAAHRCAGCTGAHPLSVCPEV
ncbi:uncharacterized protein PFL1_03391 [Pseudozyma flocculosa PF-1]|uniref:Uncharacterized protein n=1 Tax=Pseudozyma flocculosa PF-1 TaxID=1277687 RepID=A0A061H8A7_9BASI|nr:uncharacterized protein PFL1_03391 [Pseudozyma flocculosa PF-1]EPQ29102.1 hypothetical protein PFL1_03391 [Pseudozyma flocculosa PF-1]